MDISSDLLKIVLVGSTKNTPFFQTGHTLGSTSHGFPIFEFIGDTSTLDFTWTKYINIDLSHEMVAVKLTVDSINFFAAFVSTSYLNIIKLKTDGSFTEI